jgi:hypothetical protein
MLDDQHQAGLRGVGHLADEFAYTAEFEQQA